jgi:hypothetical protein
MTQWSNLVTKLRRVRIGREEYRYAEISRRFTTSWRDVTCLNLRKIYLFKVITDQELI